MSKQNNKAGILPPLPRHRQDSSNLYTLLRFFQGGHRGFDGDPRGRGGGLETQQKAPKSLNNYVE